MGFELFHVHGQRDMKKLIFSIRSITNARQNLSPRRLRGAVVGWIDVAQDSDMRLAGCCKYDNDPLRGIS
jgi:hypothetical protein